MDLASVLGPVCTVMAVSLIWPQVIRIYKLNSVEGVSSFGTLHGLSACTLWTMYAVSKGIVPLIVSNAAIGAALLMIGLAQVRHKVLPAVHLIGALVVFGVVGLAALSVSVNLAGWIAIVIGVTSILPQTLHAARAPDLSAVSLPTYGLIASSAVLWCIYGSLIGDPLLVTTNALICPCGAFIAVKAWQAQRIAAVGISAESAHLDVVGG
jgi:uncharacterized protein with PQ loop repeat